MVFFGFSPPWSSPDVTRVKETGERWKGMGGLLFFFVCGWACGVYMVWYLIDLVGGAIVVVATRCGEKAREGRLGGGGGTSAGGLWLGGE